MRRPSVLLAAGAVVALAVVGFAVAIAQDGIDRGDHKVIVPGAARTTDDATNTATSTASETAAATDTATATSTGTITSTATATATETSTPTAGSTSVPPTSTTIPTATATATTDPNATPTPQSLPTTQITVSDDDHSVEITVQVASTPQQHRVGLMWVTSMPENEGMFFEFQGPQTTGFWMQNTYIPLDIAYLGSDGEVLDVHQGIPLDTTSIPPDNPPYFHTLEMNAGWFAANGFEIDGDTFVEIPAP